MVYLAQTTTRLIDHPSLVAEWHPTKNGKLKPDRFNSESYRSVWWQCKVNPQHEWQESVHYRTHYPVCPICDPRYDREAAIQACLDQIESQTQPTSNLSVVEPDSSEESVERLENLSDDATQISLESESLLARNPLLAQEWHSEKNAFQLPNAIAWNSRKLIWWQCARNPQHEWKDSPYSRTKAKSPQGCPLCERSTLIELAQPSANSQQSKGKPATPTLNPPPSFKPKTEAVILFTGMYWITGGTGTATCVIQTPNASDAPLSRLLKATSYTGAHWSALLIGLQDLVRNGFTGDVVAMTDNSKTVQYMNQTLKAPHLAKSKAAGESAIKILDLVKNLNRFEIKECSLETMHPVIGLAQSTLDNYLKSLLDESSNEATLPLPIVEPSLAEVLRPILNIPYPSDQELKELESVAQSDEVARMDRPTLISQVPSDILQIAERAINAIVQNNPTVLPTEFPPEQTVELILRWYRRGLPLPLAIRKALLFVQSRRSR